MAWVKVEVVEEYLLYARGQAEWMALAAATVVVVLAGWIYWKSTAEARRLKGRPPVPPGSFGWPFLGETFVYLGLMRANRLSDFFNTRVAKNGPVFKTHLFFNPTVSVTAPDGNKMLFSNENKLVQSQWPPSVVKLLGKHSLASKLGEDHRQARRTYSMFFSPENLQSFVPRIDALAKSHIAKYWEGKDAILGLPVVKEFTMAVAANIFLSLNEDDSVFHLLAEAIEVFQAGVLAVPFDLPGTLYRKSRLARERFLSVLDPFIAERKQELDAGKTLKNQDLLSVLLTTPEGDGTFPTVDSIKDNILLLIYAGHDTSSVTMALVLKYLYLNPSCLKEVIQEQRAIAEARGGAPLTWEDTRKMTYTWRVCQETLRLQPPVQQVFRTAIKDFEYAGYTIPKGWALMWCLAWSQKLPELFPDPLRFDPSRFESSALKPYILNPFGGGPKMCVGNEFARMEMVIFLHHIALNFDWEMVDPNEFVSIEPMPLFKRNLQLNLRKRDPTVSF